MGRKSEGFDDWKDTSEDRKQVGAGKKSAASEHSVHYGDELRDECRTEDHNKGVGRRRIKRI